MKNTDELLSSLSPMEAETAAKELLRLLDGAPDRKSRDDERPSFAEAPKLPDSDLPFYYDERVTERIREPVPEREPVCSRITVPDSCADRSGMELISDFFSRDSRRYDRAFQIY